MRVVQNVRFTGHYVNSNTIQISAVLENNNLKCAHTTTIKNIILQVKK